MRHVSIIYCSCSSSTPNAALLLAPVSGTRGGCCNHCRLQIPVEQKGMDLLYFSFLGFVVFFDIHLCQVYIWGFPKMGVPQNHPFHGIFSYKPSLLGYPHLWKPPFGYETIWRDPEKHICLEA